MKPGDTEDNLVIELTTSPHPSPHCQCVCNILFTHLHSSFCLFLNTFTLLKPEKGGRTSNQTALWRNYRLFHKAKVMVGYDKNRRSQSFRKWKRKAPSSKPFLCTVYNYYTKNKDGLVKKQIEFWTHWQVFSLGKNYWQINKRAEKRRCLHHFNRYKDHVDAFSCQVWQTGSTEWDY